MRVFFVLFAIGVAVVFAQPSRGEISAWIDKNRILIDEKMNGRNVIVRFYSLTRKDYAKLAAECVNVYKRFYENGARYGKVGIWCYVYDNARAMDTDLRPPGMPGKTSGSCWIYRASIALSGQKRAEKNDPLILQTGNCPRP